MMDGFRTTLVSGLVFLFTIAALSRIMTAKQVPSLISSFGTMLSSLFKTSEG